MVAKGSTTRITICGLHAWSHTCRGKICGRLWPLVKPRLLRALKHYRSGRLGKAMFAIRTCVEEEMLEHIRHADTLKAAITM